MIKLALTVNAWLDEELMFAQQLGADQVIAWVTPGEAGLGAEGKARLSAIRNRVEKAGFELLGLDASFIPFPGPIPGKDRLSQDIDIFRHLITNAGAAGIPLICYQWGDPQQPWDRLAHFLDGVLPTAEKAGVRLAGRLNPKTFISKWTRQTLDQPWGNLAKMCNGLDVDLDVSALQNGSFDLNILQQSGLSQRLFLITLDHILPDPARFDLAQGNCPALVDSLKTLYRAGYAASVRPDRHSQAVSDADYQELAYAAGYLRAALQTLQRSV